MNYWKDTFTQGVDSILENTGESDKTSDTVDEGV